MQNLLTLNNVGHYQNCSITVDYVHPEEAKGGSVKVRITTGNQDVSLDLEAHFVVVRNLCADLAEKISLWVDSQLKISDDFSQEQMNGIGFLIRSLRQG